jgi:hypothetical protein
MNRSIAAPRFPAFDLCPNSVFIARASAERRGPFVTRLSCGRSKSSLAKEETIMSVEDILRDYFSFAQESAISEIAFKVRQAVKSEVIQERRGDGAGYPKLDLVEREQRFERAN